MGCGTSAGHGAEPGQAKEETVNKSVTIMQKNGNFGDSYALDKKLGSGN